jgi:hypothetical protein
VEAQPTAPPTYYPPRRWPWVVGALVALALAGAAVWYFAIRDTGSSGTIHGPSDAPFTVAQPQGWESLSEQQLSALPGSPLAVIRQSDGNGIVVINTQAGTKGSLEKLSTKLVSKLQATIPDFKLVTAHTVTVKAGPALTISYARTKKGTANTLLVVPVAGRIYTLNAVVPAGQKAAAQQAGNILSSFDA